MLLSPSGPVDRWLCVQARLAEALYETPLACVLLLKPLDARHGLSLPAGTNAQIPQVAKQDYGLIVVLGLLGGDERAELAPGFLFSFGKRVKPELARRSFLPLTALFLAGCTFALLTTSLLGSTFGGLEQITNRVGLILARPE